MLIRGGANYAFEQVRTYNKLTPKEMNIDRISIYSTP
jgi:hypothetical protein